METAFKLALFFTVAAMYLGILGYLPARLLVRGDAARFRWLFLAPLGFCTLAVLSSLLNTMVLPMGWLAWVLLAAGGLGAVFSYAITGSPGLPRPGRVEGAVAALAILSFAVGVAPLVNAGSTTFLGVQWDLEIYLPLTEYLKGYAANGPFPGPASPLLEAANSLPVRGGSGLGFSYFDAAIGTVINWPSDQTFRPSLHALLSLSVPSVYLFARVGLKLAGLPSLIAAGLAAGNGLNQWLTGIGLAGHTATLALLPLALLGVMLALRSGAGRDALLASLATAAMLLCFYTGALAVFGAVASGAGAAHLVTGSEKRRVLAAGVKTLVGVALLGAVAHVRFLELLPLYFGQGFSEGWHIVRFSPASEALGLSTFSLIVDRLDGTTFWGPEPAAGLLALVIGLTVTCGGLAVVALLSSGWDRRSAVGVVAAVVAFGLVLRFGAQYHYGYFKLLSLTSFVLSCLIAQGIWVLWQREPAAGILRGLAGAAGRPLAGPRRALAGVIVLVFLPLFSANTVQSLRFFWNPDENEFPRSVWELSALRSVVPPGAPVYVAGSSSFDPRTSAMVAYFLRSNPMVGNVKTAYGELRSQRPDEYFSYLLLRAAERPEKRGLTAGDVVWRNDLAVLYRRPVRWLSSVDFESVAQPIPIRQGGEYKVELTADSWTLSDGQTSFSGALTGAASRWQIELSLLSMGAGRATVRRGAATEPLGIEAGLWNYRSGLVAAPGAMTVRIDQTERPSWLLGLRVVDGSSEPSGVQRAEDLLLLHPAAELAGTQARLTLDYLLTDTKGGDVAVGVEVYRRGRDRQDLRPVDAWQIVKEQGDGDGEARFVLDAAGWRCGATPATLNETGPPPPDGEYEAHVAVYYLGQQVARWPWLDMVRRGQEVRLQLRPMEQYHLLPLPLPAGVAALASSIPVGLRAVAPPVADPDSAFIPIARSQLSGRLTPGDRTSAASPLVLLPRREIAADWGLGAATVVWKNTQAVLYRAAGEIRLPPGADDGANEWRLRASPRRDGSNAVVEVELAGPRSDHALVGLDVYGERACGLDHFGWWAIASNRAPGRFQAVLEMAQQRGRFQDGSESPLPFSFQTWPVSDGRFRAFLYLKQGEVFDSFPAFEFTVEHGRVIRYRGFAIDRAIPLRLN